MANTTSVASAYPNQMTLLYTGVDAAISTLTIPNAAMQALMVPGPLRDAWNAPLTTQARMRLQLLGGLRGLATGSEGSCDVGIQIAVPAPLTGTSEAFFYAYNVAAHTAIALSGPFPFDTAGPTSGVGDFLFTASANPAVSGAITVVQAGTYLVEFSATVDEPRQISLWVGGVIANPTTQSTRYGGATGTTTTTGFAIITLTAGQVLSLRNDQSTGAITPSVAAGSGPSAIVVNSIMIKRLNVSPGGGTGGDLGVDVDTDAVTPTKAEVNITGQAAAGGIAFIVFRHRHTIIQ